ncbi:hypothetical protein PAECIP111893_01566 [Paenibacillus plantiphilus]|uniref:Uncharacterized protein n=1 Tax=Paenibacillus plantiphilus TaxID=2905650 RepID=A0ABM9C188_9BACL|nr:hypothetical protein PAECIP111893_01566 [Paenibacillus plantiphilus]
MRAVYESETDIKPKIDLRVLIHKLSEEQYLHCSSQAIYQLLHSLVEGEQRDESKS